MIACKTTIGFGLPTHAGTSKAHSDAQGAAEIAGARKTLNWPYEPFVVPEDILRRMARGRRARRGEARSVASGRSRRWTPAERAEFERRVRGDLPKDLDASHRRLQAKLAEEKPEIATRKAGEAALNVIAPAVPELVTGSADLTPSNNTKFERRGKSRPTISPAATSTGASASTGWRRPATASRCTAASSPRGPRSSVFTDYCRPSLRLAALMGIRVVHVFTHDSIGLGEDGPTHQPVEHLASLRAMPNFYIWRPGRQRRDGRVLAGGARARALALDPGADAGRTCRRCGSRMWRRTCAPAAATRFRRPKARPRFRSSPLARRCRSPSPRRRS